MTDEPPIDLASERVKKAMARKKPVTDAPFDPSAVPGDDAGKARRRRTRPRSTSPTRTAQQNKGGGPAGLDPTELEKLRQCAALDPNDRDNGRRLLIWSGDDLIYVANGPRWHKWCGTHHQPDPGDLNASALAQKIVDRIKLEADELAFTARQTAIIDRAKPLRDKEAGDLSADEAADIRAANATIKVLASARNRRRQFAISSGNAARTEAMLKQAAAQRHVLPEELDRDQYKLNVKNGTLVFSRVPDPDCPDPDVVRMTGHVELLPHDRSDLITRIADVEYDPAGTCPRFQAFLDKVQPGAAMQRFLQVAHGYAGLIGGNDEQRLIYHFGRGANGKSAFMETCGRMLGGYRAVTSPDSLVGTGQRPGNQQNSDMARLYKVRLVTVEELPRGEPLKENLIKQLTGGSRFVARFLNREFFEFDPTFTAVMAGNDMPTIGGTDYGIWRRLLIVPWRVQIPESERIPFGELLASFDSERSGILNWLIEGVLFYLGQGLAPHIPSEVREFTDKHREDRDVLGNFIDAYVVRDLESKVQAKTLLDAFTAYCEQNAIKPWHQATVGAAMKAMGFEKEQGRHVHYVGMRLIDPPSRFDPPGTNPASPFGDGRG